MPDEKPVYTQTQLDAIVAEVRIEERFIANQLMGDLGIPAERRVAPDGKPIYTQAADIVMKHLLRNDFENPEKSKDTKD